MNVQELHLCQLYTHHDKVYRKRQKYTQVHCIEAAPEW